MKEIYGTVRDKDNNPLPKAKVALLNNKFEMEFSTETDDNGKFDLKAIQGTYPFFISVKEYKENYLEYWCQNINLEKDLEINPKIGKLEIYGLHAFPIKGAGKSLMVYFRPMSLAKFQLDEQDLSPDISKESLTITINGEFCEIVAMTQVQEKTEDSTNSMTSYLVQVAAEGYSKKDRNILEVTITDKSGEYGEASLFCSL